MGLVMETPLGQRFRSLVNIATGELSECKLYTCQMQLAPGVWGHLDFPAFRTACPDHQALYRLAASPKPPPSTVAAIIRKSPINVWFSMYRLSA